MPSSVLGATASVVWVGELPVPAKPAAAAAKSASSGMVFVIEYASFEASSYGERIERSVRLLNCGALELGLKQEPW